MTEPRLYRLPCLQCHYLAPVGTTGTGVVAIFCPNCGAEEIIPQRTPTEEEQRHPQKDRNHLVPRRRKEELT